MRKLNATEGAIWLALVFSQWIISRMSPPRALAAAGFASFFRCHRLFLAPHWAKLISLSPDFFCNSDEHSSPHRGGSHGFHGKLI
ncbi:hypothetical protein DMENIID0001_136690 [Sergentomyia squamirostris]